MLESFFSLTLTEHKWHIYGQKWRHAFTPNTPSFFIYHQNRQKAFKHSYPQNFLILLCVCMCVRDYLTQIFFGFFSVWLMLKTIHKITRCVHNTRCVWKMLFMKWKISIKISLLNDLKRAYVCVCVCRCWCECIYIIVLFTMNNTLVHTRINWGKGKVLP